MQIVLNEMIYKKAQIKIQQTGSLLIYQLSEIKNRRGQLKIQQMAFVLVALMIFFGLVSLIYFRLRVSNIEDSAVNLKDEEAKELVRKLSGSAEFAFTSEDCSNCIDFDKVLILSERKSYEGFWNLKHLEIQKVYPESEGICNRQNYPKCDTLKIIDSGENTGAITSSFVSLCRWESGKGEGYYKCEIGRILASGEGI